MPEILDYLLDDSEEPLGKDRAAAFAGALRKQNNMAVLGTLMGIKPTQAAGQMIGQQAEQSLAHALEKQRENKRLRIEDLRYQTGREDRLADLERERLRDEERRREWQLNYNAGRSDAAADAARYNRPEFDFKMDEGTGEIRAFDKRTGREIDPQTGEPITGGGGTAAPGGAPPDDVFKLAGFPGLKPGAKMTESQSKNFMGAQAFASVLPGLESVMAEGFVPNKGDWYAAGPDMPGAANSLMQEIIPRETASPESLEFFDYGGKLLIGILRPESGGAITKAEWQQYAPQYLPWPGDPPERIAQKMAYLRQVQRRLAAGSGGAARYWREPAIGGIRTQQAPGQSQGGGDGVTVLQP